MDCLAYNIAERPVFFYLVEIFQLQVADAQVMKDLLGMKRREVYKALKETETISRCVLQNADVKRLIYRKIQARTHLASNLKKQEGCNFIAFPNLLLALLKAILDENAGG